jgi:hypothetical protein
LNIGGSSVSEKSFTHSKFQTNLLYIQKHFEDSIKSINLEFNHILFIDGIDIRPANIEYHDYLECVKGLANAVWSLNNDFFAGIPNSKGRLRVVLLIRPDIFASLGLQNQNNKIKDNSVLLDWKTTYQDYGFSKIFRLADRIFSSQQTEKYPFGTCWNYYFPYTPIVARKKESSFIQFLRFSMYRPRDIISMFSILQENLQGTGRDKFKQSDFDNGNFQEKYSAYLLGEIKDYLSFYYSDFDYELFLKFFEFLEGRQRFTYNQFITAFTGFNDYVVRNNILPPKFFESADTFLQFIYELNVICYIEHSKNERFIRWCFRERNYSNIAPKVKSNEEYQIHYGLIRALHLGKKLISAGEKPKRKRYNKKRQRNKSQSEAKQSKG